MLHHNNNNQHKPPLRILLLAVMMLFSRAALSFTFPSLSSSSSRQSRFFVRSLSSSPFSSVASPPPPPPSPAITLTSDESELFDTLLNVVQCSSSCSSSTTLRVAGGWVRDKLLLEEARRQFLLTAATPTAAATTPTDASSNSNSNNNNNNNNNNRANLLQQMSSIAGGFDMPLTRLTQKKKKSKIPGVANISVDDNKFTPPTTTTTFSSSTSTTTTNSNTTNTYSNSTFNPVDIDVALDNMLGREFAEELNTFYESNDMKPVKIGMVLKNPEKSKHLETATMKVGQYWIDFVNLRAEEYTSDSRIPGEMRIGSPLEDSFRRDLTINSLFYNLNTKQIEDFTGRGLDDLKNGIVSTPLPPLTTLLDDPLRVLRAVRFAARLKVSE